MFEMFRSWLRSALQELRPMGREEKRHSHDKTTSWMKTRVLLFLSVIGVGALSWILESAIMVYIFHEGDLITQILNPVIHELWQRIVELGLVFGFAFSVNHLLVKHKQAERELRQRNKELAVLNAVAATASQSLDLDRILNGALDAVLRLNILGDDAKGMLFLLNDQASALALAAHRGVPENHPCLAKPPQVGECLCGLAVKHDEVIICHNCWGDARHTRHWPGMPDHKDICLPLKVRTKKLGAMNVRLSATHEVTSGDVELLKSVADQVGVAIENAQLFETVSRHHERLHRLGAQLAEAEEAERQRLARELHDQVGQNLSALGVNLNVIGSRIPKNVPGKVRSCLVESLALIEQTTERIRNVMADLRPPMLDDYGLMAALRWYGDQLASRTGLSIKVQGDETDPRLPAPVEIALFRIAQEALTNAAKHARAAQARVTMEVADDTVRLVVTDDGRGFDTSRPAKPGEDWGWGLLIMAERAEALGGRCRIESHPPHGGTQVILEVRR
jgi:signal transduction histidine kinase